jgi:glycogen synthase
MLIEPTLGVVDSILARQDPCSEAIFEEGDTRHPRTVWILSYTGCSNEPRVLRQAFSLARNGWNVVVAGFEGHSPRPAEWSFIRLADKGRSRRLAFRAAMMAQRGIGKVLYTRAASIAALAQAAARLYYFGLPNWRQNYREVLRYASSAPHLKPDLVVAHDFYTSPPAACLAQRYRAALIVDCHEYGRGQYMENPAWVRDGRLFASAMQDDYLARADAVTTVCDGIRDLLNREQRLKRPVVTVRSVPFYEPQPFRSVGERIRVLYHGILASDRALEQAVESVKFWRPEFSLTLRGPVDTAAVARLCALAERNGVADRVAIEPPVPFADIVSAANRADIGYFVQGGLSPQRRFTLPNKFFEYIMAGLALCVSDLPEMSKLVNRYGCGILVPGTDPETIAGAINALTPDRIEIMKRASLAAARDLNWGAEERTMLSLFEQVSPRRC